MFTFMMYLSCVLMIYYSVVNGVIEKRGTYHSFHMGGFSCWGVTKWSRLTVAHYM